MELPKTRTPESILKYRGTTPSADITDFIKDTADDVATLFAILNDNNDKLSELQSIVQAENRFLFDKNAKLNDKITELTRKLAAAKGAGRVAVINAFSSSSDISFPTDISEEYGQITLPVQKYTPKLYLHDQLMGNNIIPPSLTVNINQTPAMDTTMSIRENDVMNIVDGDSTTAWQRVIKVPKTSTVSQVQVDITIALPYEIISNRYINTISVCPHPIQGVDLIDIQYKSKDSYVRVPGFADQHGYQDGIGIPNAGPIRLLFGNLEASEIKVSLVQKTSIEEGNFNVFYIGAYSIDVGYSDYASDTGEFLSIITLDGDRNIINQISAISDNQSLCGESFQYKLYTLNEFNTPVFVSDRLPAMIDGKKMMLQGTIVKNQNAAPAINTIELRYETSS